MRELADYVSAVPGCSIRAALRGVGLPECGQGHVRPIRRALTAGLIIEDRDNPWARKPAYALFRNERDRAIFNLRKELLHGGSSPARAAQIRAEVEVLRAEQASTWVA